MNTGKKLCPCCMEVHDQQIVSVIDQNVFKGIPVEYSAEYCYCSRSDEMYADEKQLSRNDIAMKNTYREKTGLLTSFQIIEIRNRYGISQGDLCVLLGWGEKTITRYESHQVQDKAHDTILRKLDADPEWFIELLNGSKDALSDTAFSKYLNIATKLFEKDRDMYLKSAIRARYAGYIQNLEAGGGKELSLDTVVDMINYYANSINVISLYLVKLMKLLWYADALSYKRRGYSISGMVYRALPMGAVPVAYESIIDLSPIQHEEIYFDDGIGYRFLPVENKEYPNLSQEDRDILEAVISRFGRTSRTEIVETMHMEDAFIKTALYDVIPFEYTRSLSIS